MGWRNWNVPRIKWEYSGGCILIAFRKWSSAHKRSRIGRRICGVNVALQLKATELHLFTYSACFHKWIIIEHFLRKSQDTHKADGIVELYLSLNRIAARKQCSIMDAVYWHNATPKDDYHPSPRSPIVSNATEFVYEALTQHLGQNKSANNWCTT